MPFLAPLAVPAIMGGLGLGAGALGNKLSKAKPSPTEQMLIDRNLANQQQLNSTGTNLLNMGQNAAQTPMNYWQSIAGGNRSMATAALAPEIGRIGEGYQAAGRTVSALNPRGGPTAAFNAQLPFNQQKEVTSLLQGSRAQAIGQMAPYGQQLLTSGVNAISNSTNAGRDIFQQQQNLRELEERRGKSIGSGLFDILEKYGFPAVQKMLQGKGGGGMWGDGPNQES